MITAEPTEQLAGLTFWGDAWDLEATWELIHRLCEEGSPLGDAGEFVLGLAYDIRKAKDGYREKRTIRYRDDRKPVYGVPVIWVYAIAQVAMLRGVAAFTVTTPRQQSVLWAIEAAVGEAVQTAFPSDAAAIMETMERFRSGPWPTIADAADSRAAYFVGLAGAEERRQGLLPVLQTLEPGWAPLNRGAGRQGRWSCSSSSRRRTAISAASAISSNAPPASRTVWSRAAGSIRF